MTRRVPLSGTEAASILVSVAASIVAFWTSILGYVRGALAGSAGPIPLFGQLDRQPTPSTTGLIAVGALVTAIGGAMFPYWKAWLERSDLRGDMEELRARFLAEQEANEAKTRAILKLAGQMRQVLNEDRDWMRAASVQFGVPLPEGFASRPFDRLVSFDPDALGDWPQITPDPDRGPGGAA